MASQPEQFLAGWRGAKRYLHLEQNIASLEQPYLPETDKQRLAELFGHIGEYA